MKALTLWQPWASLVAIGDKQIETRSWSTPYRGPLAIHAAKALPVNWSPFAREPFLSRLRPICGVNSMGSPFLSLLPRGKVIATCTLYDVIPVEWAHVSDRPDWDELKPHHWAADPAGRRTVTIGRTQRAFGDYSAGRFAWLLKDIEPVDSPIEAKGVQRLWNWDGP